MLLREQVTCTLIWGEESLHFLPYKSYNNPWIIDIKFKVSSMMACLLVCRHWGQMASQKRMNFRKSSKQPLIPPLIFGKSYCIFLEFHAQNPYLKVQNLQYEFLDSKWYFFKIHLISVTSAKEWATPVFAKHSRWFPILVQVLMRLNMCNASSN